LKKSAIIPIAILTVVGLRFALPLSAISCSLLFFLLTYLAIPWLGTLQTVQYWMIGFGWFVMTVLFEFLFGRLVANKSWAEIFQAYDILTGNLWSLVLLFVIISPYVAAQIRGLIE
jgi:hypothetical protein